MSNPVRSCINFCAPVWDFTSTELQRCAVDPCDETLFDDPAVAGTLRVCPGDAYCRPDFIAPGDPPSPFGGCIPADGLLTACARPTVDEPSVRDTCGPNAFCTSPLNPRVLTAFNFDLDRIPVDHVLDDGICFYPVVEGQECDSNLSDRGLRVDGEPVLLGEMPCEIGTVCVDDPTTTSTRRVCQRACTGADGAPDPSVCDCDDGLCRAFPDDQINPATGENLGRNFCRPCLRSNRAGCGTVDCCDTAAGCNPSPFLPDPGNTVCCRSVGSECDPDATIPQCCENGACTPRGDGTAFCAPCAIDGEEPGNSPCCPGHALVGEGTGDRVCRRCSFTRLAVDTRGGVNTVAYCGEEVFEILGSSSSADGVAVPNSEVSYPNFFGGLIAGGLPNTAGDAAGARIDLGQEYRAYLFESDVMGAGAVVPSRYVELPNDDLPTGGSVVVPTRLASANSFMLHDLGACSARVSFDVLAGVLSAGVHQQVAKFVTGRNRLLTGVTARGMTISPVLRATEGVVYGLGRDESLLQIQTEYDMARLGGLCGPHRVTITADILPDLAPGFIITPEARADDAAAEAVGCTRVGDTGYTCTLPVLVDGVISTETRSFVRRADFYADDLDAPALLAVQQLENRDLNLRFTSCRAVRDVIECTNIPSVVEDTFCHPEAPNCPCTTCEPLCGESPFDGSDINCFSTTRDDDPYAPRMLYQTLTFPRRVVFVPGARDIELTVTNVAVDLSGISCVLEEVITGGLEGVIRREIRGRISEEVSQAFEGVLGSRASRDFGVPVSSLQTCTFDSDCTTPVFGGSRTRCVDHDGNGGTPSLCDGVRLEVRRLYVSPRGLDLVIADGPDDPQFPPINGRVYPPIPGRDEDVVSCSPDRLVREPGLSLSSGAPTTPVLMSSGSSTGIISDAARRFCDGDEVGDAASQCICAASGTACGNAIALAAAGFSVPSPPRGLLCAGPTPPAACGVTCTASSCAAGFYCDAGTCTADCVVASTCGVGFTCDADGRCVGRLTCQGSPEPTDAGRCCLSDGTTCAGGRRP